MTYFTTTYHKFVQARDIWARWSTKFYELRSRLAKDHDAVDAFFQTNIKRDDPFQFTHQSPPACQCWKVDQLPELDDWFDQTFSAEPLSTNNYAYAFCCLRNKNRSYFYEPFNDQYIMKIQSGPPPLNDNYDYADLNERF